jgi:PAS domain S-box-containing protein
MARSGKKKVGKKKKAVKASRSGAAPASRAKKRTRAPVASGPACDIVDLQSINAQLEARIDTLERENKSYAESADRFRTLIERGAAVYTVIERDGTVIYQSSSVLKEFGWQSSEVLGMNVFALVHPDDLERTKDDIAHLADTPGATRTRELRLRHKDGTWCDIEVTGVDLSDVPSVGGILLTTHDVTARKWAEEALRQVKGSFSRFIKDSSFGYVEVSLDGNLSFTNDRAAAIAGYTTEELLGLNFKDIVHPHDHDRAAAAFESPETGPGEYRIIGRDGDTRYVEVCSLPITKAGKPFGLQITISDITERKTALRALEQSRERFRELAELLPGIVYEMDTNGTLSYLNKTAFEETGYSREDFERGFEGLQAIAPEDRERAKENMARLLAGEDVGSRQYKLLRKDGSTLTVLARASRIVKYGQTVGLRGVFFKVDT